MSLQDEFNRINISCALSSLQGETGQKFSYLHDELVYVKVLLQVDDSFVNIMETQVSELHPTWP